MSVGTAVKVLPGRRDPSNLYIQLRNQCVYKYSQPLTPDQRVRLVAKIERRRNRVPLKNWVKVR